MWFGLKLEISEKEEKKMFDMLPTKVAMHLAEIQDLKGLLAEEVDFMYSIKDFQKIALTGEFATAKRVFELYMHPNASMSEEDEACLQIIYDTTKDEARGIVVEQIMVAISGAQNTSDRVNACKALEAVIGKEEVADGAVSQFIVKLAGGGK